MKFSEEENVILEKITHDLLEYSDIFINSLMAELNLYEMNYNDSNVKYKRFLLFFLFIMQYFVIAFYIQIIPMSLYFFLINFVFLIIEYNFINKLNNIQKFSRLGDYRKKKKNVRLFRNQIPNILNFRYTNNFESILKIQNYIGNLIGKFDNYLNFFKNITNDKKGRFLYGLKEIIVMIII